MIRSEKPSDINAICEVTKAAFKHHSFRHRTEHFIIRDLRNAGGLALSLVKEVDGQIVGHIAFSLVTVSDGTTSWYSLGPVSVRPDFQGQQIGSALVNSGLARLRSMGAKGCVLVGLPTYYHRFGFGNHPELIHEDAPREIFGARPLSGKIPKGTVEFHPAFKQLSVTEKDAVSDAIIDFEIGGIKADLTDPAIESLIEKGILIRMSDAHVMLRPSALAVYDSYFGRVAQFRADEMSRVHKNPILAAVTSGAFT